MRIIFMGTPDFAVPSLEAQMSSKHDIVAVITAPDKPRGRGNKISSSPIKKVAENNGIPILQPHNLKDSCFLKSLQKYNADLQVVVAFRMIPIEVWSMPTQGTFNLHASLLPNYRGAAPINWAIINGESQTGLTTFFIDKTLDTGDIILQKSETIHPSDNAGTLHDRLSYIGADLVVETVDYLEKGNFVRQKQLIKDEFAIKKAPKIYANECKINWNKNAECVLNQIRGLSPYPAAWFTLEGKICKVIHASIVDHITSNLFPGEVLKVVPSHMYIGTATRPLSLLTLKLEGKNTMNIHDFLNGFKP